MATNGTSAVSKAAAWKLDLPASTLPAESARMPDDGRRGGDESAFEDDERVVVDLRDLQDGGKYRSIVKIQSCFLNKATGESIWMMGTGWLIRPDLLVTAGHVVYDWGHRLGAATQLKCYIGYNGRDSVKGPDVQARFGTSIVTTAEWISAVDNRPRDVAFIRVDKPFTGNLRTFSYVDTPEADSTLVGVVGYPGDKALTKGGREEKGAQMYEQFKRTTYDLDTSARHMVEYKVSTFGGQSGAAILCRNGSELTSIGTHCYGGGGVDSNSGNSIGGRYGNNYSAFVGLFALGQSTFGTAAAIKFVDAGNSSVSGSGKGSTIKAAESVDEEGFFDVLKKIARVGSKALPVASGLLGPVGGLVGTAAGALLGSVAEAQNMTEGSLEVADGAAERAMLAEATLQAVMALPDVPERREILDKMQRSWTANAPKVDAIAAVVTPQLTECALDIALDRWGRAASGQDRRRADQEAVLEPRPLDVGALSESALSGPEAGFITGLFGETKPLAGEEGMFDWLAPVLKKAVTVATPLVTQVAKTAISAIGPKLLQKVAGAESAESPAPAPNSKVSHAHVLLQRAVMADTALQAVMSLPREKLDRLQVHPHDSSSPDQAEGIFDFVKTAVQKMGPVVLDTAKNAAKTLAPVLLNAVASKVSGGSVSVVPSQAPAPGLKRGGSLLDELLRGVPGVANGLGAAIQVSQAPAPPTTAAAAEAVPGASEEEAVDLAAILRERDAAWQPSRERRSSWDSNDDLPPVMDSPPPAF